MIDMDKQDFLSKYHWLRDVDQILLMEAFDQALCFLKDSIAENVRLEQRMKSMNMVMGIPDHAVETMDYIYEEFQNLEGYRHAGGWHAGARYLCVSFPDCQLLD